jgi:hypothetical protein
MRILGMLKSDPETEAGGPPPDKELIAKMGSFVEEMTKAGVLLATNGLHPSSKGKRVKVADGKVIVVDGPFTESKELVASYAIYNVKSWDEAIQWTTRFLQILGRGECELRPIFEMSDFAADLLSPEQIAQEKATREQMERNAAKP